MVRFVLVALAVVLAAPAAAGVRRGGLRGTVTQAVGGTCPDLAPCRRPAAGVTLVFERPGRRAITTRTGDDGSYRVRLAPGRYAIGVATRNPRASVTPSSVRVPRGRFARVRLSYDPGVRAP